MIVLNSIIYLPCHLEYHLCCRSESRCFWRDLSWFDYILHAGPGLQEGWQTSDWIVLLASARSFARDDRKNGSILWVCAREFFPYGTVLKWKYTRYRLYLTWHILNFKYIFLLIWFSMYGFYIVEKVQII